MDEAEAEAERIAHYRATLGVDYAAHLAELHCRFFRRVDRGTTWLGLVGGATSVASLPVQMPVLAAVGGGVVTCLSLFALAFRAGDAAAAHSADRRKFMKLKARCPGMTSSEITSAVARIAVDAQSTFDSLLMPAFNDTVRAAGQPEAMQPLTPWQRLARAIA